MSKGPPLARFLSLEFAAGGALPTRLVSQRIGAVTAFAALRMGMGPSHVTILGIAVVVLGALAFALLPPGLASVAICVLLLQLGYGLDCADGQLARATDQTSAFGAWLDVSADYLRNIVLAAALAYRLISYGNCPAGPALAAAATLLAGCTVQLHTVTTMRQGARPTASGFGGPLRATAVTALDTAMFLLVLPLLRDLPAVLAAFAVTAGVAYGALAVVQARHRLGAAREFDASR